MENLRYMLSQYNSNTALYFGHRFAIDNVDEGYMAGGGYILSKKALKKYASKVNHNSTKCHVGIGAEDVSMGSCLAHSAIFVDNRDEFHQQRFFPMGIMYNVVPTMIPDCWYTQYQYYQVPPGLDCCSATSIGFNYILPVEMFLLEKLIYKIHPFGLDEYHDEKLPRKLTLGEVINASDVPSLSPNFKVHEIYHELESSEIY